jgi:tetratricopeptide (TPR) repeat protein
VKSLLSAGLSMAALLVSGCQEATDYETELSSLADAISAAAAGRSQDTTGENGIRLARHLLTRASLTGDFRDYRAADAEIARDIRADSASPELHFLRASLDFKLHRIGRVSASLDILRPLVESPLSGMDANPVVALEGDMALHEGRYAEAESLYRTALARHPDWGDLCRLAYLKWKTGKTASAESLYTQALDGISAKEMRTYAWIELQLGRMDFENKRFQESLAHYLKADQAYSGYWMTWQYRAETLAALGRTDEAMRLYKQLIENTGRPKFMSELAELLETRNPVSAAEYYQRADRAFDQEFDLYPEAMLGDLTKHLLRHNDGHGHKRLIEVATRNYLNRPNGESELLLAKSYWASNQSGFAKKLMGEIGRTPWKTTEMSDFRKILEGKP